MSEDQGARPRTRGRHCTRACEAASPLAPLAPSPPQVPQAGSVVRRWYRRSRGLQIALLVTVMLATAMVIGDGVLTPSISGACPRPAPPCG